MSGTHAQDPGEEPEAIDPAETDGDGDPGEPEGPAEGEAGPHLPTLRPGGLGEGGGWGRIDGPSAVIDHWAVPAPPFAAYEDIQPAWKRWLGSRAGIVLIAAAVGGIAGALAVSGLAGRSDPGAGEAVEALRNSIGLLAAEVRSLKDGVGEGSQATAEGLAAIEQRIAGAETAQKSLSAKIATLSTTRAAPAPPPPPPSISPEITGSIALSEPPPPVSTEWVLWRVRNGRALVQGGAGYFEVEQGSALPGLGIVQRIVKQDGRWIVFTPNAVIVARG